MKIKKLIKLLSAFDPEAEIFQVDCEWGIGMMSTPRAASEANLSEIREKASRPGLFSEGEPEIKLADPTLKHGAVVI